MRTAITYRFSGAKLREAREVADMTREELSVATGRGYEAIRSYETGRAQIPLIIARRFARALGIDLDDLMDDE